MLPTRPNVVFPNAEFTVLNLHNSLPNGDVHSRGTVINWIGPAHYSENVGPLQNLVRFIINGGELPTALGPPLNSNDFLYHYSNEQDGWRLETQGRFEELLTQHMKEIDNSEMLIPCRNPQSYRTALENYMRAVWFNEEQQREIIAYTDSALSEPTFCCGSIAQRIQEYFDHSLNQSRSRQRAATAIIASYRNQEEPNLSLSNVTISPLPALPTGLNLFSSPEFTNLSVREYLNSGRLTIDQALGLQTNENQTGVGSNGAQHLARMPALHSLNLTRGEITSDAAQPLAHMPVVAHMPVLTSLNLTNEERNRVGAWLAARENQNPLSTSNPSVQDDQRAIDFYRQAADRGSEGASFQLGQLYQRGWGDPTSDETFSSGLHNRGVARAIQDGLRRANLPAPSESNVHSYWYQKAGLPTEELTSNWENLKNEPDFAHFVTLLTRLGEEELRNKILASDVVEVIQSAIISAPIRQYIFEASREAAEDCHERPLSIFNTVQGFARFAKLEAAQATPQELLILAKGIARQTILDEATTKVMHKQWEEGRLSGNGPLGNTRGTGPNTAEALEYQMALRLTLGTELNLPFALKSVYAEWYINEAVRLTEADKKLARGYVNEVVADEDRLITTLMSQPIWKQYMERSYTKEIATINEEFGEKMNRFEEEHEEEPKTDGDYYTGLENLGRAREQKINSLLENRTRDLCKLADDK
ncbi:MAG: C-terminal ligase, LRR-interacting [Solimicrobium sp.]|jgi:hypothetical protein|nr:C-terminal ligase, LRR-interacting [Solimicrobium sp.]